MAVQATFASMGIRTKKSISHHLLVENAYENNLLSDISRVDYLANNRGRTHLRPLDGLPVFVDDVYVFGYLRREDTVETKGKVLCTTGEFGFAKKALSHVVLAIRTAMGNDVQDYHIHASLVHTIAYRNNGYTTGSTIRATVANIEAKTNRAAKTKWMEIYDKEPEALFLAKVDVSEIPIEKLQTMLPFFEKCLLPQGYCIYSIDYTQDFSGVLDRKTLVEYLGKTHNFREQGDFYSAMCHEDQPTILANTDCVGNHVCTWIQTTAGGRTSRTKIYNKIVSNFEAGEVLATIGSHLAEYVDCPNKHLRKTFQHPDVQERGCTRIEVSIYGCFEDQLSIVDAKTAVDDVLELVSPNGDGLFVVQSPLQQWKNLAVDIDRCLVVANRSQGEIFVAWYAHTRTSRVSGVRVVPKASTAEDDTKWERAVCWAIGDFGFRACPIFRIDILANDEDNIEIAPLRCYTKDLDAKTILAASKMPTQLHEDAPDPAILLPETPYISWIWRQKKSHAIGIEQSEFGIQEVETKREISTLSKGGREARMQDIADALLAHEWRQRTMELREVQIQYEEEQNRLRKDEVDTMQRTVEAHKQNKAISEKRRKEVLRALEEDTKKVSDIAKLETWEGRILGYRRQADEGKGTRVVLANKAGETTTVWATNGLSKILDGCIDDFQMYTDKYNRSLYWIPECDGDGLYIDILPQKTFQAGEAKNISWNPIAIVATPTPDRKAILQDLANKANEYSEQLAEWELEKKEKRIYWSSPPAAKNCTKTIDIPEGEYGCRRYSTVRFRGTNRLVLYLYRIGGDGEAENDTETPVYGWFLQAEIEKFGGEEVLSKALAPIRCHIGVERTTGQNKKDRLAILAV
jgi:hypothetical protein